MCVFKMENEILISLGWDLNPGSLVPKPCTLTTTLLWTGVCHGCKQHSYKIRQCLSFDVTSMIMTLVILTSKAWPSALNDPKNSETCKKCPLLTHKLNNDVHESENMVSVYSGMFVMDLPWSYDLLRSLGVKGHGAKQKAVHKFILANNTTICLSWRF